MDGGGRGATALPRTGLGQRSRGTRDPTTDITRASNGRDMGFPTDWRWACLRTGDGLDGLEHGQATNTNKYKHKRPSRARGCAHPLAREGRLCLYLFVFVACPCSSPSSPSPVRRQAHLQSVGKPMSRPLEARVMSVVGSRVPRDRCPSPVRGRAVAPRPPPSIRFVSFSSPF